MRRCPDRPAPAPVVSLGLLPLLPLSIGLACGGAKDAPAPSPEGQGTEIGDEGGAWACDENSVEITDLSEPIAAVGGAPQALIDAAVGAYAGPDLRLALAFAGGRVTYFDNEPNASAPAGAAPPECLDLLTAEAEVSLVAPGLELSTPSGWLSFSEGGGVNLWAAVRVHEQLRDDPDDDEGGGDEGGADEPGLAVCDAAPSTFSMDDMMWVEVVLLGARSGDTWSLQAKWVGDTLPMGEDADVLSLEEPIWSGTAAAAALPEGPP